MSIKKFSHSLRIITYNLNVDFFWWHAWNGIVGDRLAKTQREKRFVRGRVPYSSVLSVNSARGISPSDKQSFVPLPARVKLILQFCST